jgi:hypothetical protein
MVLEAAGFLDIRVDRIERRPRGHDLRATARR